jgi:tripartite-type tricarboxylate transporter receptor subunit TctC
LPGFVSVAWFGLVAPPETPDAVVEKISRDVVDVLRTEEMRKKFEAHAAEPMGTTPKETAAFLERERTHWGGVIEKANLKGRD